MRIFIVEASPDLVALQIDGQISKRWVDLLRHTCEIPLQRGARLVLDLKNVSFLDRDGIALLKSLYDCNVEFLNAPQLIAAQIGISPSFGVGR